MAWIQLTIQTDSEHAEALAEFLEQFGANAISFSATDDEKIFDNVTDQNHELWQATTVSGLLPADVDLDILLVCLRDRIGAEYLFDRKIKPIKDQDWVEEYKKSQPLLWYKEKLCICPSWLDSPDSEVEAIILDPGLAFGTGTHPTTSLCMEWLADHEVSNHCVIDYGCGSGILAMAAARLGARPVYAVDIDPQAIQASLDNLKRNQLEQQVVTALVDDVELPVCDVLLANVLLNPLLELADHFSQLVKPGGQIVLSGLLGTQVEECLAAYNTCFNMQAAIIKQEWAMLEGTRL